MSTAASTSTSTAKEEKPVKKSSTCTNCRERHLKCDGGPVCSRCKSERANCIFVASRRGQRKPSSNRRHELESGFGRDAKIGGPNKTIWTTPIVSGAGKPPDFSIAAEDSRPPLRSPPAKEPSNQLDITHTASSVHLLGLFYSYFFPAHPFVLPRGHLSDKFNKNECPQLQAVVEYLGACHDPMARKTDYLEMVNRRLFVTPPPQNPYTVQALLLFAIDAHANHEKDRALDMVRRGIRLALDLGMHSSVFATTHGFGDVVIEECWRRTFWELYIIERVLAADSRASESILITRTPIAVPLPCEESEYLTGNIYKHQTFEDFENRAFLGDDITFSSYAYRIDAARILASTLRLAANPPPDETTIEKIDHELGQWCLYLPDTKRTLVSKDGIYDEVLFHAHALTFYAAMLLHRPRSKVAGLKFQSPVLDCFPDVPATIPSTSHSASYHTAFLLRAAESMAKLLGIPRNTLSHTPLFTCCLVMSASAYLSIWSLLSSGADASPDSDLPQSFKEKNSTNPANLPLAAVLGIDQSQIRQQVLLLVSSLKKTSQTWTSAKIAVEEIRAVSLQAFATSPPPRSSPGSETLPDAVPATAVPQHGSTNVPIHPSLIPNPLSGIPPAVPRAHVTPHYDPGFQAFGQISQTDVLPMEFYGEAGNNIYGSFSSDSSMTMGFGRPNTEWGSYNNLSGLASDRDRVTAS